MLELTGNLARRVTVRRSKFTPIACCSECGAASSPIGSPKAAAAAGDPARIDAAIVCRVLAVLGADRRRRSSGWSTRWSPCSAWPRSSTPRPARCSSARWSASGRSATRSALNASNFHLGALIGPAISGLVIGFFGSGWSIAANADRARGLAAILFAVMRARDLMPAPVASRAKGQIREAVRYVRGSRGCSGR